MKVKGGWTYLFATIFRAPAAENTLAADHEPAIAGVGRLVIGEGGGGNLLEHGDHTAACQVWPLKTRALLANDLPSTIPRKILRICRLYLEF